ncbi:MAG: PVC-type heme-binding CxxCH protein [Verrucomicrobiota bacterium]
MRHLLFSTVALCCLSAQAFSAPAFELKDGDRVALLGDAFIEREQYNGWIEIAATTRFPQSNVTFRNLGWNADLPSGDSRSGLSPLQAGMEGPDEGWKQLQNQLSIYKPNVIILGYGMAASLPNGCPPEKFGTDLERLLDDAPKSVGKEVRFLVLGAPPRFERPGEDASVLKAHRESLAAANRILQEIATRRGLPFVSLDGLKQDPGYSQNGIHLTDAGYQAVARLIEKSLGWQPGAWDKGDSAAALRKHILKKNEWFFNRSRPANMAYIFGFRKGEQGNNAVEIPQFDALIAAQEQAIAKMRDLSKGVVIPIEPARTESKFAAKVAQPHPNFTVAAGYEISLWAESPLLHKPTQMNFDPSGKLWIASSQTYPQVEVGQTADDKILVLQDSDGDGKADKSTVFADGMMMPTAVLPGDGGVYVGQSTDLLHFTDTDGDGKADTKTRVLSGFGTEDTHHNIHTLRRGPDGLLWFNQSIYTRTDTETPNGIFRLRSGGIMRFDPRAGKLETVFYGWLNAWGHQFDRFGQSFVTDGAGVGGINWGVPGAMYTTYANAPKVLDSVSPGSYPKFAGLEIIESPHFPADWQGNLITCDFRAHRIVRFGLADQGAGYAAQEIGDLVRTDDVNFRPIDVKTGPDGALYIADWSNPIINHGEVDFRDPRRDREHGRIWRVTKKGGALVKPRDLAKLPEKDLLEALSGNNRYDRNQATAVLFESKSKTLAAAIKASAKNDRVLLSALWLGNGRKERDPDLMKKALASRQGEVRAAAIRVLGDWPPSAGSLALLKAAIADEFPRVRLEAIRVLSKFQESEAMDVALGALNKPTDRFIDYALWLNVQERGEEWLYALANNKGNVPANEKAREFVLGNLPPAKAAAANSQLAGKTLPKDGSGPYLGLALKTGDAGVIGAVFEQVASGGFDARTSLVALKGINDAIIQRQIKLRSDSSKLLSIINGNDEALRVAGIALGGTTASAAIMPRLIELAADSSSPVVIRSAAVDALGNFQVATARDALVAVADVKSPANLRQRAALALSRYFRDVSVPLIVAIAAETRDPEQSRQFWQQVLSAQGISKQLATAFEKKLTPEIANLTLQHVPDVAEHDALLKVLREQAGAGGARTYDAAVIAKMAELVKTKGDAARGELVYRRPAIACTACHAIGGAGGKVGPDLTSIGASAPLDYLIESTVNPGAKVKEGYHSVILETKDGKAIMGQLVKSGNGSSVIRDGSGAEITVADNMVSKKTDAGSLMPGNLIASLPESDINDLFKFLSELGKPGDFDATKSHAPKVWAVHPVRTDIQERASQGDPTLPWVPVTAPVNGSLLPADARAAIGHATATEMMIATKLQLAETTEIQLDFPAGGAPVSQWVDGVECASGSVTLQPGIHKIVIRAVLNDKPVQMKCASGTFLPEW